MAKVSVLPRDVQPPPGFPKARVSAVIKRAREAMEAVQAVGGIVAAVEITPEGSVRVLTTAGDRVASAFDRGDDWDTPPRR